mmetsp:Transcript_1440/g.2333  ORF Transcript_1440/g.2333 Transcript_1440/m.2333 type:complete len:283 (-) Transcript_1440:3082-3930(-)
MLLKLIVCTGFPCPKKYWRRPFKCGIAWLREVGRLGREVVRPGLGKLSLGSTSPPTCFCSGFPSPSPPIPPTILSLERAGKLPASASDEREREAVGAECDAAAREKGSSWRARAVSEAVSAAFSLPSLTLPDFIQALRPTSLHALFSDSVCAISPCARAWHERTSETWRRNSRASMLSSQFPSNTSWYFSTRHSQHAVSLEPATTSHTRERSAIDTGPRPKSCFRLAEKAISPTKSPAPMVVSTCPSFTACTKPRSTKKSVVPSSPFLHTISPLSYVLKTIV